MSEWKRPDNVPFPSIWKKFEGRKKINGVKRQYWIQDLTDQYKDKAIELMISDFMRDQVICKSLDLQNDPIAVDVFKTIWLRNLEHKLALICLTEDEDGKPEIAGLNMTYLSNTNSNMDNIPFLNSNLENVFGLIKYIYNKVDVAKEYHIDEYLTALGLLVLPKFRGEGIGAEILKSRRNLCQAVGIKASITMFSSKISQAAARKAGFQDITEISYEELEQFNPKFVFPVNREYSNCLKYMYIEYK